MQKIEYKDEVYYYYNHKFLDTSYIEVNITLAKELANFVLSQQNYETFDKDKFLEFAKETKEAGQYKLSEKVCLIGLSRFNDLFFIRQILPILTSNMRNLNKSQEAIDLSLDYIKKYKCESVALLTSLAAAYCDIKDYEKAKKYANFAYAKQGGSTGYTNELSLVYKRLKKENGES